MLPTAVNRQRTVAAYIGDAGDRQFAGHLAHQLGLDDVHAELLPAAKTAAVAELKNGGHTVAMIGDGISDAPAMATAHVAVAMGSAGTDVALVLGDVGPGAAGEPDGGG